MNSHKQTEQSSAPAVQNPAVVVQPSAPPEIGQPQPLTNEEVLRISRENLELHQQLAELQTASVVQRARQPHETKQETKLGTGIADAKRNAVIKKIGLARFSGL